MITERFDAVVLGDVIEHTVEPLETVKPGGTLVVSVPNVAHLSVGLSLAVGLFNYTYCGILDKMNLRFFTRRTFRHLLQNANLYVLAEGYTLAPVEEVLPAFEEGRALGRMQSLGAARARSTPSLFAYQFVVQVSEKPSG